MSDLISRQAMLDGIDKLIKIHFDRTVVLYKARKVAENLPSAQPEQRWIPVTERLPEIDKEVLVTDGKLCWVCSLFESQDAEDGLYQWEDNYGHWHEFETWVAWMPLPGPWKGEEDATD